MIIAYTALMYGVDYLADAIRSVIDHIDLYYILYTDKGSHGHRTDVPCPDTYEQLYAIAQKEAGSKLRWINGSWNQEGQQRDSIFTYMPPQTEQIVVLDADEVWPYALPRMLQMARESGQRNLRVSMVHFWRSFAQCFTHDPAFPVRIINPKIPDGYGTIDVGSPIAHLGYAQRSEIVKFKLLTHGHRNEFRKDCDWFNDKFMANAQTDCHPVGSDAWNVEKVDPWRYLPDSMRNHKYANLDLIP